MVEVLDPQYLRETAGLIRGIAKQSRLIKKDLWSFWIKNRVWLAGVELEERRQLFGHHLYESGHTGFAGFAELPVKRRAKD